MLGCYDFCGHYEWTFAWLAERGGHKLVREYWDTAIHRDSQTHARELILSGGIDGMKKYWAHTLDHEAAGFAITHRDDVIRIDMHDCPSKGFLLRNGLAQFPDYCDHCMGWIGPLMKDAGFVIDHEHNHRGQCWWEMRNKNNAAPPSTPAELSGPHDVRLRPDWQQTDTLDRYERATDPDDKSTIPPVPPPPFL
ncbi:hypothetical protein LBMAG56_37130 [Verrucomicrobiota bacterium]|nr:hypothetical protein LBMAG56_37130 [Verrucomicrobiota bacterium]